MLRTEATREIAASNRFAVVAATTIASMAFSILALRSGNYGFLIAQGLFGIGAGISANIIKRGYDRTGRYIFAVAGNFMIFMYADSLPHSTLLHLFFLTATLFPAFVLPFENWKRAIFPTLLPIVLWSICLVHGPGIVFAAAKSPHIFSPFFPIFSVTLVLAVFFFSAHRRFLLLYSQIETQTLEQGRQERMIALAKLAANVAHDVNNPLTLILAKAERISRRATNPDTRDDQVNADAQRVIQTVDRIAKSISLLHDSALFEIELESEQRRSAS